MRAHPHPPTHTHTCTHAHTCAHTHTHTCAPTHMHTHTHTCTHAQTHIHSHTCILLYGLSVIMLLCFLYCHNIAVWSVLMFSQHVVVHLTPNELHNGVSLKANPKEVTCNNMSSLHTEDSTTLLCSPAQN